MARYYNAETLLEFVRQNVPHIDGETTMKCVERAIDNAPTADVVEVVRCGECRCCTEVYRGAYFCSLPSNPRYVQLCHFCSYGKRRDT